MTKRDVESRLQSLKDMQPAVRSLRGAIDTKQAAMGEDRIQARIREESQHLLKQAEQVLVQRERQIEARERAVAAQEAGLDLGAFNAEMVARVGEMEAHLAEQEANVSSLNGELARERERAEELRRMLEYGAPVQDHRQEQLQSELLAEIEAVNQQVAGREHELSTAHAQLARTLDRVSELEEAATRAGAETNGHAGTGPVPGWMAELERQVTTAGARKAELYRVRLELDALRRSDPADEAGGAHRRVETEERVAALEEEIRVAAAQGVPLDPDTAEGRIAILEVALFRLQLELESRPAAGERDQAGAPQQIAGREHALSIAQEQLARSLERVGELEDAMTRAGADADARAGPGRVHEWMAELERRLTTAGARQAELDRARLELDALRAPGTIDEAGGADRLVEAEERVAALEEEIRAAAAQGVPPDPDTADGRIVILEAALSELRLKLASRSPAADTDQMVNLEAARADAFAAASRAEQAELTLRNAAVSAQETYRSLEEAQAALVVEADRADDNAEALRAVTGHADELRDELDQIRAEVAEQTRRAELSVAEATDRCVEFEQQADAARREAQAQTTRASTAESLLAKARGTSSTNQAALQAATEQHEALRAAHVALRVEAEQFAADARTSIQAQDRVVDLEAQLEKASTAAAKGEAALHQLHTQQQKLTVDALDAAAARVGALQAEQETLVAERDALAAGAQAAAADHERAITLAAELDQASAASALLEQTLLEAGATIAGLEDSLARERAEREHHAADQAAHEVAKARVNELEQALGDASALQQTQQAEAESAWRRGAELADTVGQRERELDEVRAQVARDADQVMRLQAEAQEHREHADAASAASEAQSRRVGELEAVLADNDATAARREVELTAHSAAVEQRARTAETELTAAINRLEQLDSTQRDADQLASTLDAARRDNERLAAELELLTQRSGDADADAAQARSALASASERLQHADSQRDSATDFLEQARAEAARYAAAIALLEAELTTTRHEAREGAVALEERVKQAELRALELAKGRDARPPTAGDGGVPATERASLDKERASLDKERSRLEQLTSELAPGAAVLAKGTTSGKDVARRAAELGKREHELTRIAESLSRRRDEMRRLEKAIGSRERQIERETGEIERRLSNLKVREDGLDDAETEAELMRAALERAAEAPGDDTAGADDTADEALSNPIQAWLDRRRRKQAIMEARQVDLDRREESVRQLEERVHGMEQTLAVKEADLSAFAEMLQQSLARAEEESNAQRGRRRKGDPTQRLRFWTRDSSDRGTL